MDSFEAVLLAVLLPVLEPFSLVSWRELGFDDELLPLPGLLPVMAKSAAEPERLPPCADWRLLVRDGGLAEVGRLPARDGGFEPLLLLDEPGREPTVSSLSFEDEKLKANYSISIANQSHNISDVTMKYRYHVSLTNFKSNTIVYIYLALHPHFSI